MSQGQGGWTRGDQLKLVAIVVAGLGLFSPVPCLIAYVTSETIRAWATWWLEWLQGHLLIAAASVLATLAVALVVVCKRWRRRAAGRAADRKLAAERWKARIERVRRTRCRAAGPWI
jgi:hypothetical protein